MNDEEGLDCEGSGEDKTVWTALTGDSEGSCDFQEFPPLQGE